MKLRPRNRLPAKDSSTVPTTAPVPPSDITRLKTPPISELSNAGSTTVRKDRLSDVPSSVVDESDMQEERTDSTSPARDRRRLKISIPRAAAAPLTQNNLEKLSEEITSDVEVGGKSFFANPVLSPHARLVQARNNLLAYNRNTMFGFAFMLKQIDDFLQDIPEDLKEMHASLYDEVEDLVQAHRRDISAGDERLAAATATAQPTDPHEYTNKFNNLIRTIRRDPTAHRPSTVTSHLRALARPLNRGHKLPSADEARRLITERIAKEGGWENEGEEEVEMDEGEGEGGVGEGNEGRLEDIWTGFEDDNFPPDDDDDDETEMGDGGDGDGWNNVKRSMQLGRGDMMPKEVREWDWERDRGGVLSYHDDYGDYDDGYDGDGNGGIEEDREGEEEGEVEEAAQLLLAETPFLQMLMGEQIARDLESGEFCFLSPSPSPPLSPSLLIFSSLPFFILFSPRLHFMVWGVECSLGDGVTEREHERERGQK